MAKYLVACDDGHGMETAGKRTPNLKSDIKFRGKTYKKGSYIHENEFNKNIMNLFIEGCKRCGINTIEIAHGDKDVPLKDRVNKANSNKVDLYISFHANALTGNWQEKAYGLVVLKHEKCYSMTNSLANNVYKNLKNRVNWYSNGATKYGVRKDTEITGNSLYVLKNTKMPAILIEYGFMDNWNDVKNMCTDKFSRDCAEATLKGVCETLNIKYIKPNMEANSQNSNTNKSPKWKNGEYSCKVKTTENLNLRTGRGTNNPIIMTIPKGTVFEVGYIYDNWGSTWDFKGQVGYFCCDYIVKI